MPKISIIVPVYNVEEYIHRCIDSILAQTFTDFELILVNDGSPDQCGKICDEYAKKHNRIKVIHKKNGGLSDARNAGLDISQGDFIGFVDSDDYIEHDMYEKLIEACKEYNSKLAMCGRYKVLGEELKPMFSFKGHKIWESREAIEKLLTWDNIDSSACDKLFSRNLFEELRFPVGKYNEDIYIMTQIIHQAGKIVHIGDAKYYYFHRTDSITTEKFSEKKLDLLEANQKVSELVKKYYPHLEMKVESFNLKGIIYLSGLLQDKYCKNHHLISYNLMKKELSNNIFKIISNQHIDTRLKIKAILIATKIYSTFRSIKQKLGLTR